MTYARYVAIGFAFGLVLMKSEAISWFRIQEMFRFQSFHMFGILGCAAVTAGSRAPAAARRRAQRRRPGHRASTKTMGSGARYAIGGTCLVLGWAIIGACPGPLFALLGAGVGVMGVAILAALAGTWTYAMLRERLPH